MSMTEVYKQTREYSEGRYAFVEGIRRGQNPYASGEKDGNPNAWWMGWDFESDIQEQESQTIEIEGVFEPEYPSRSICPHCGKDFEDFSDLGCEYCDRRHPHYGEMP